MTSILMVSDLNVIFLTIDACKMNEQSDFTYAHHKHDTRNACYPVPSFQRLTTTQQSLPYSVPTVWTVTRG